MAKKIVMCPACSTGKWKGEYCLNRKNHVRESVIYLVFNDIKGTIKDTEKAMQAATYIVDEYSSSYLKNFGLKPRKTSDIKRKYSIDLGYRNWNMP